MAINLNILYNAQQEIKGAAVLNAPPVVQLYSSKRDKTHASKAAPLHKQKQQCEGDEHIKLRRNEFQPGFETNNFFTTFNANADTRLTEREFTDGTFGRLDRDGMFSENEFNTFNDRYFGF